ncbi:response regulator [Ottowia thiooxydans]|uniref:Two-component system catabolic regulation response regulator CreB n=1 Tax=Ottowia thiooxydans TaxID=219182 RepID=A0ABV2Q6Q3_9BURK
MHSELPLILVVEDEPGIAETIHYALSSDGFLPEVCATARHAMERFTEKIPALAILDVGLPDMSGFELLRRLQDLPGGKSVPMLFLTARAGEIDRVVGLELGADDYIAKPFSPRELVARVRTILRRSQRMTAPSEPAQTTAAQAPAPGTDKEGGVRVNGSVATAGLPTNTSSPASDDPIVGGASLPSPFVLDEECRLIHYHGQSLNLSRYEYGLLAALIQRPGRVFTRNELLERVWDDPGESFDRTVDAHIKTLRGKLRLVREDEDPIRTLRGIGYALRTP